MGNECTVTIDSTDADEWSVTFSREGVFTNQKEYKWYYNFKCQPCDISIDLRKRCSYNNSSSSYFYTKNVPIYFEPKDTVKKCDEELVLSINEAAVDHSFSLYPNPSNYLLNIEFPRMISGNLIIRNIVGEILFQKKINNSNFEQLDLRPIPSGSYIIHIGSVKKFFQKF